MIGSRANARKALQLRDLIDVDYEKFATPVDDWSVIGVGCDRVALLGPDRIIYKIAIDSQYQEQSILEMRNIRRIRKMSLPDGVAIPAASTFLIDKECVIAMEYIPNPCSLRHGSSAWTVFIEGFEKLTGIIDLHRQNVREKDGIIYVIDLGITSD